MFFFFVTEVKVEDSSVAIEVLIACNAIMFVLMLVVLFWKFHVWVLVA